MKIEKVLDLKERKIFLKKKIKKNLHLKIKNH